MDTSAAALKRHPGITRALLAAREAPFLLWLFLPFLQTLGSKGEPLVCIVETAACAAFLGDEKRAYLFFAFSLNLFYAFHSLTVLSSSPTR